MPLEHLTAWPGVTDLSENKALLLIGHGSARYPEAGSAMQAHAESLRAGGHFSQVEVAVLDGAPSVAEALARIDRPVIRVVPFFMEDGYFTRVAVPRAVEETLRRLRSPSWPGVRGAAAGAGGGGPDKPGHDGRGTDHAGEGMGDAGEGMGHADEGMGGDDRGAGRDRGRIVWCPPVGVHDGIAGVIERQALAACEGRHIPSHAAAVVVVGHGSASAPGQVLALHRHASRVASTTLFARVEAACLEETPFLADTLGSLRTHPVVVIGFFANNGGHVLEDVPALIAAEAAARGEAGPGLWFHGSVINDPEMVPIVLDQAQVSGQ
jgi:sirohydrochlorin cobaltochelatase